MRNKLLFCLLFACFACKFSMAQESDYRRSSIYSLLVCHSEQKFANEICNVFTQIPVPDKYNDHNLSIRMVKSISSRTCSVEEASAFLENNFVASRLVCQWFNHSIVSNTWDVELIKSRGLYNANQFDRDIAAMSIRGNSLLEDAGENLIQNTFVLVNDIEYVDKENTGKAVGAGLKILGQIAAQYTGTQAFEDLGNSLGSIAETLRGFKVKIHTHLYQLEWNEEIADQLYTKWYTSTKDVAKNRDFQNNRGQFKLKYIGSQLSKANDISIAGVNLEVPEIMVRKACQRALDENIADLQKNFESFKIKTPLLSTEPITADIGLKEGITPNSKFEVLEVVMKNNKEQTKRVGIITPVADKIWDNRYMASEEKAVNSDLKATTFKKVSGGDFVEGMLIREIK